MIHGSYGTLGILTRLVFRLVPAKPYVELEYRTLPSGGGLRRRDARALRRRATSTSSTRSSTGRAHSCLPGSLRRRAALSQEASITAGSNIFYKCTGKLTEDY